jgi:hypothetical protein
VSSVEAGYNGLLRGLNGALGFVAAVIVWDDQLVFNFLGDKIVNKVFVGHVV